MSFIFWNCCGLGNLRTGKELEVVVRAKDPSTVFLAETWADEARLKEIKRNLEFKNLFFVERNNRGGGLALYWRNSIDLTVETCSKYHIDAIINKGKADAWRMTGFYEEPMTQRRAESWSMLRQLNSRFSLPRLCVGDFNELLQSSEKLGGNNRSQNQMQLFRDVVDECGFVDLGYVRPQYTWQKHFADGHSIWERLDRGFANNEWLLNFASTKVHHLSSDTTDHRPLWIVLEGLEFHSSNKPFWFEEMWLSDPGCAEIVKAVWSNTHNYDPAMEVMRKIAKFRKELHRWNREHFGNVRKELEKKRAALKKAEDVETRNHRTDGQGE